MKLEKEPLTYTKEGIHMLSAYLTKIDVIVFIIVFIFRFSDSQPSPGSPAQFLVFRFSNETRNSFIPTRLIVGGALGITFVGKGKTKLKIASLRKKITQRPARRCQV